MVQIWYQGHGEIRCIDDVVYVVVFVRRLGYHGFDGIERRVVDGYTRVVVDQLVAAIAYWGRWFSVFGGRVFI